MVDISSLLENKWTIPAAVGVASLAGGFTAGYFIGRRNAKVEYRFVVDEIKKKEELVSLGDVVEEAEEKGLDILVPEAEAEELIESIEEGDHVDVEVVKPENFVLPAGPVSHNVFQQAPDDIWDQETENASRSRHEPYTIHRDEFMENEKDFSQETLTYYAGDDIMADETDTPIYNYSGLMGELKFGHGSGDKSVVYIRNEVIRKEWEVLRHDGRFEIEVAGYQLEQEYEEQDLKHSAVQRFRTD